MSARALDLTFDAIFAGDVTQGLSLAGQKELQSKYLYDELGSVLFDAITVLPEYGLTRADARLLQSSAGAIVGSFSQWLAIAELGSGTGAKTRWILEAAVRRGPTNYFPIDISPTALEKCREALDEIAGVAITPIHASYLDGLKQASARRQPGEPLLVLFLGSTIGNFDSGPARKFLRETRACLRPGDGLLLGADLIKPVPQMIAAYDDPTGVTAAFNLNLLGRINRELDGRFDLRTFEHVARFNEEESRIEMHLRSRQAQSVRVGAIDRSFQFRAGETIWTESSYKFRTGEIAEMASQAGFTVQGQWIDREWPFAETLLTAA
jgi:dimethylhistidine N-methyltransferase